MPFVATSRSRRRKGNRTREVANASGEIDLIPVRESA
jgi:hypothetical protein